MSDFPSPYSPLDSSNDERNQRRSAMAETLQQALRSLQSGQQSAGGAGGAPLTPEQLTLLAQRAGLTLGAPGDSTRGIDPGLIIPSMNLTGEPQYIVFALHAIECALPGNSVQGVERLIEITPVPNLSPWVLGVVHLRGSILSVVDLRAFLGFPTQPMTVRSRMLLATSGDMMIGLLVDAVTEMRPLNNAEMMGSEISTPDWAMPYAERTLNIQGRTVVMLDPERLLFSEKMHRYRAEFG